MTMNISPLSMFPANTREEELLPSVHMLGGEKAGEGCVLPRRDGPEVEAGAYLDVVDLLPTDPFGMDLEATFSAIAGWIEGYQAASELDSQIDEDVVSLDYEYDLLAGVNFFMLEWEPNGRVNDEDWESRLFFEGFRSFDVCEMSSRVKNVVELEKHGEGDLRKGSGGSERESPHDAIEFVMKNLDLTDLLSMERVCRTTRDWVRNNASLWRNIHIGESLNGKLTDDALVNLTKRAEGSLESLSLMDCNWITDDGMRVVMLSNPTLLKLCVPGCTRLSVDGILHNMKACNSLGKLRIKCLRLGELYGVTPQHFEELRLLLGLNKDEMDSSACRRRIYPFRNSQVYADDIFGPIDIQICSRCQNPRILYDCPVVSCQGKPPTPQGCRACTFCIKRCCSCGVCINYDTEYEETFSLDLSCAACWKKNEPAAPLATDASVHSGTK